MGSFRCSSVRPSIHPSAPDPFDTHRRPLRVIPFGSFGSAVAPAVRSTTTTMNCWLVPLVLVFPFDSDGCPCPVPCPTNQPTTRVEFPCPIGGGRRRWTSSLPKWRHSPESMFVCHCYTQKQNHINTTRQTESKIFCYFFIDLFFNCNLEN